MICASDVTSASMAIAFPPFELILSATALALSPFRSMMATAEPSFANNSAVHFPMPAPPPVIKLTLFLHTGTTTGPGINQHWYKRSFTVFAGLFEPVQYGGTITIRVHVHMSVI